MSVFAEQLSRYVEESSFSKNALIAASHINRSTFFQFLSGRRLPNEEKFEALIQALQLGPGDEGKLRRLYKIALIGESVHENRQRAQKCLETLAGLSGDLLPQLHRFQGVSHLTTRRTPLQGENQVLQELCYLVRAEMFLPEPQIDLFLPLGSNTFFEYLKLLYRNTEGKTVHLRQLIQFARRKGEKVRGSLEFFDSILYFLASNCTGYEAHYYYMEVDFADTIGVLYPYSAITSSGVLLLNETMDRALFSTTPAIIEACRAQFEDALGKSKRFYTLFQGEEQIINFALDQWDAAYSSYQYFFTPCFGAYLTREMGNRCCPEGQEALFEHYYNSIQEREFCVSFCTAEGLLDFARDGLMGEYPGSLVPALEVADRKALLETMLYQPPENSQLYLIDEDKLPVSTEFVFSVTPGKWIFSYRKGLPNMRVFCFTEQNLLQVFMDFFGSLPESDFTRPREELELALRRAIDCCDAQMMGLDQEMMQKELQEEGLAAQ